MIGITCFIDGRPNEVPNPVPFRDDRRTRPYDSDAVTRFFQAIVAINRVLNQFRTGYIGKVSHVVGQCWYAARMEGSRTP